MNPVVVYNIYKVIIFLPADKSCILFYSQDVSLSIQNENREANTLPNGNEAPTTKTIW